MEIRRYLGWNGSGMVAILPVNMLPEGLPEPDRELCQGHPETVDRSGISLVHDVWSREFREGSCDSLHPGVSGPEIGWNPYTDRHDIWSAGRFFCAITLPRATAGSESGIQCAVGNRLVQEDDGLEDTLAPVPPATE